MTLDFTTTTDRELGLLAEYALESEVREAAAQELSRRAQGDYPDAIPRDEWDRMLGRDKR